MSAATRCVIVGGGQAGAWVARTLRAEGFAGAVTILGAEPHHPYERPPLSKAFLSSADLPDAPVLLGHAEAERLGIDVRVSVGVTDIDRRASRVAWDGGVLSYDRLFLTTGGLARTMPGLDASDRVHMLRSIDDSLRLRAALRQARSVLVLGGGWIGLEVAAAARGLGLIVTVLERDLRLCRRSLPPIGSDHLLDLHAANGVDIRLGMEVRSVREGSGGVEVSVADGTTLRADLLVAGLGMVPQTRLAERAGLAVEDGIIVDLGGRTSDPAIFAAGDVARHPNSLAGGAVRLESWTNAQDQAISAAKTAIGLPSVYDPVPWFWSDQYDTNIQVCGFPDRGVAATLRGGSPGPTCWLLTDGAGRAVGGIGVNAGRDIRTLRRALAQGRAPDPAEWGAPQTHVA